MLNLKICECLRFLYENIFWKVKIYLKKYKYWLEIFLLNEWLKVARKLAMVEADLERAEERAETGESWVNEYSS